MNFLLKLVLAVLTFSVMCGVFFFVLDTLDRLLDEPKGGDNAKHSTK